MLAVRNLSVRYRAIQVVQNIDFDIAQGEIVALIGANGAGKTTVARAIAGLLPYRGSKPRQRAYRSPAGKLVEVALLPRSS